MTVLDYQNLILGILDTFKTVILDSDNAISTNIDSTTSGVETRYITSEEADQEQWLGYLRNANKIVDIFLITVSGLKGQSDEDTLAPVGAYEKPLTVIIDYFADYHFGIDETKDVDGNTVETNTEREFQKKVIALDFWLEHNRDCLPNDSRILKWVVKSGIKNFLTGATHIAKFDIDIVFQDIPLS